MNYFAKNLKYLREQKHLDQQELAEELNVPQSTLSCWETGIRTPKIEQILDIANYFNADIDIISKDYSLYESYNNVSELDQLLYSKAKDLSDEDKIVVMNVIDSIKRNIDNEDK